MLTQETAGSPLQITFFGPVQVLVDGRRPPHLRSRKTLWLLVLLTLRHGRPVEREWLAATLWPEADTRQGFANLRPILSDLRHALGSESTLLQSPTRYTLLLDLTGAEVDLIQFDAAITRKDRASLQEATALYRGPLLEGCSEEWVTQERFAREQECLQALQALADAALAEGDAEAAIGSYRRAAQIDPGYEAAQRGWMEALARKGDRNAALQVYREFLHTLRADPRATPDPLTSALYNRLRAEVGQSAGSATSGISAESREQSVCGYLPHPLTELVGREDERIEVMTALRRARLVTLAGPGGIGKTRLATAVAMECVPDYPDGVWLVALEGLSEPHRIASQIASVLGITEEPGLPLLQRVIDYLRPRRALLLLDNCEHLLDAVAQAVGALLPECAGVRVLATSREALGITGEIVWTTPPLAFPDLAYLPAGSATLLRVLLGYESVRLFVERARAVQKIFALTERNARDVARVCTLMEGLPLAIELAASRMRAMSVDQVARQLEQHMGLFWEGSRIATSRQQTLHAAIDWSYRLLSEAEQALFRRLAIFTGGWTMEAAGAICVDADVTRAQVSDLLTSLVSKSLVSFAVSPEEEDGRYRFLETVRQYAAEQLQVSDEREAIRARYCDWFLKLAEEAEPRLKGAEQGNQQRRLQAEEGNLYAILTMQRENAEAALRLTGALGRFWYNRSDYSEGRAHLERALALKGAQAKTAARAKALYWSGALANYQGDYTSAAAYLAECLEIRQALEDRPGIADVLNTMGNSAYMQSDHARARALYTESLLLRREAGDRQAIADSLTNLAKPVQLLGETELARALFTESLALRRELGDRKGVADSNANLGYLAGAAGDYVQARSLLEESLDIFEELGDLHSIAWVLNGLSVVAFHQGNYPDARFLAEQALQRFQELGVKRGSAWLLNQLGSIASAEGRVAEARAFQEEALSLFEDIRDLQGIQTAQANLSDIRIQESALSKHEKPLLPLKAT